jgi:hypothetical protein
MRRRKGESEEGSNDLRAAREDMAGNSFRLKTLPLMVTINKIAPFLAPNK